MVWNAQIADMLNVGPRDRTIGKAFSRLGTAARRIADLRDAVQLNVGFKGQRTSLDDLHHPAL
ncbi:hypothetical protein [Caballeronia novacaledonica]|uniref:Uncharacterized protein n=1 Tax=Caballeronia novacaledonica TaxID=1544861 RepID=A0AA37IKC4_9BURK|nr:hypothetical protein [Caballeronia novacaledonica]GJH30309.1 hypothetical protein CBA19CS42_37355 [Caballeronia novacaledonica]